MIAERSLLWSIMTGVILFANADVRPSNGPIIIKPTGKEIILQSGQNYTLECVGKRPIQFKQQHVPEETTGDFYMEERLEALDNESEYRAMLDLYNVDQFAVGYYACFDDMVNTSDVLTDITEEPTDNEHVTHVYIYVNGSALFAPMRTFVKANRNKFIIECRPTTPDIKVKLLSQSNKTPSSVDFIPKIGFIFPSAPKRRHYTCLLRRGNENATINIRSYVFAQIPKPTIYGGLFEFMEGESFTINCSVRKPSNIPLELTWTIPGSRDKVQTSMDFDSQRLLYYKNITVTGATRQDAGAYKCEAGSMSGDYLRNSSVFNKIFLDKPILKVTKRNKGSPLVTSSIISYKMKIDIESYPPATVTVFKDGEILPETGKYEHTSAIDSFTFGVKDLEPKDSANYTLRVSNGHLTEDVVFDLRVEGYPRVDFGPNTDRKFSKGVMASLSCTAEGYPLPSISWIFTKGNQSTELDRNYQKDGALTLYKAVSTLHIKAFQSGNITCRATNTLQRGKRVETRNETRRFLIQEMDGGFGIKNADNMWFSEHDDVVLKCYVSKYDYANVSWYDDSNEELINVEIKENEDSLIALLIMNNINRDQEGLYTCAATKLLDGTQQNQTVEVTVAQTKEPKILDPVDITMEVVKYQPVNMTCVAASVPPPEIEWYKDDIKLISNNDTRIDTVRVNQTLVNSTVIISQMKKELVGTYSCKVSSQDYVQIKTYKLIQNEPHIAPYLGIAGAIFFILILIVLYLVWKIRKEKQFRKELAAAGLLYFKEGVTKSLNPALGIDEQAELLPYNEKFEFPAEKLKLGQQLGAGAFGVVYKAEARGIINAEESTTVAVKMVKKNADNMYIKALASELKIMVHLGKHINIVNLLGACTKNVGKRELIVIVEYCKFGNIHNYLLKHREVFIDQLNDNSEKTLGKVNRGFSSSSGNSALHSDYFGSNHTQNTDHTLLNTANTNRSSRKDAQNNLKPNNQLELSKVSETGYIQPEWRSNYESDYSYEGRSPRPLCSRDLLAWAFQIARGMEYLASRKVLHGDLAARNVLLAEDNVVKICDFGLARSIYNNDEYQKKENSPLPVKWLAIECMTDRVFSTQSDVWSFGIVLWELFSLAKTPYPNMSPPSLLQWLTDGHRLQKPAHADDRLYEVMKRCWAQRPTARPSFTQLQELLGSFLEDNVRNHYVDLNATYMDMNVKREGEEDYLAMVCAPEYDNIVTPSPHNYVNERSFFPPTPTQLQHDDEGYLQMSPATRQSLFNTRAQGNKFDFELQKKTPRVSEANSYGSESTPMLTLNNLPRSGSESDQEAESASPYLNMCPRIEEEADDVFSTKENNAKNCQPDGVTNPTYITVTLDDKPHYINVSVPNGLVK